MKKFRKIVNFKTISVLVLVILGLLIELLLWYKQSKLTEQHIARKWGYNSSAAQISCFFANITNVTEDDIIGFEHELDNALLQASIETTSQNPGARLWADAYSSEGKLYVNYNKNDIELNAFGVGGDYFYFHSMKLIDGSYFQSSDMNHDYCVIDKEAAWKLFGSPECVGMIVDISGQPFMVCGVVDNPKGKIYDEAGLDRGKIYISYDKFAELNGYAPINHYEIVMPNPVKQYAYNYVKEKIGVDEKEMEIVENNLRFNKLELLKHLKKLSYRAMNGKAIIYPYWENVVRVKEDEMAKLTLLQVILWGIALIIVIYMIVIWWKNRTYTFASLVRLLQDKYYDLNSAIYNKIKNNKFKNNKGGNYE